jgi:ABC transport system ATP-binding/permease protein
MNLITLRDVSLSFGLPTLLDRVNLKVSKGERICLLGRNGSGKSTLLKLIDGQLQADSGDMEIRRGTVITRMSQEVPDGIQGSNYHVIAGGLGPAGELLEGYHKLTMAADQLDQTGLDELHRLHAEIDATDGWNSHQRINTVLSRLSLDADTDFSSQSGGQQRRVLLGRALVRDPDVLLLDEPTNHLDIEMISWLEDFLLTSHVTLLFISHDRRFIKRLANRILELDRGQLTDWDCDYDTYRTRRQQQLDAELKQETEQDRKLANEEVWIRKGIQARRTRNEGRVRALKQLRKERSARRSRTGQANLKIQQSSKSGRIVIETEKLSFAYEGHEIVRDLSVTIMRGDKIGLLGPNGVGKTTLVRLLLDELTPDSGTVRHGTRLDIAYFDQQRAQLDENATVIENLGHGSDHVEINGKPRHLISYLQDFLFAPDRARSPVNALSGGERNRLLLARLFSHPSNVLVMDEPTNDLDIDTLDLLEEKLVDYEGTLLLISHDRSFLDHIVTSTLVFEGDGIIKEYVGGYEDWLRQRRAANKTLPPAADSLPTEEPIAKNIPVQRKLSYKLQHELDQLPARIEQLEQAQESLQAEMLQPDYFNRDKDSLADDQTKLTEIGSELEQAYERWGELEGGASGG